jgi:uncharacterized protein (TIGR04552 family)
MDRVVVRRAASQHANALGRPRFEGFLRGIRHPEIDLREHNHPVQILHACGDKVAVDQRRVELRGTRGGDDQDAAQIGGEQLLLSSGIDAAQHRVARLYGDELSSFPPGFFPRDAIADDRSVAAEETHSGTFGIRDDDSSSSGLDDPTRAPPSGWGCSFRILALRVGHATSAFSGYFRCPGMSSFGVVENVVEWGSLSAPRVFRWTGGSVRRDILELDATFAARMARFALHLEDVEALRLLLGGGSVIDWQRLAFDDRAQVDRFLAAHLLDVDDAEDRERLRYVYNEAVSYLEENLQLRFPADLRNPDDVRNVFLWASAADGFRRRQILSCVILKLMHVIHHMEAADLRFRTAISEQSLFDLAEARILQAARDMKDKGLPVLSFYGSRKTRSSIITKLLSKKENLAATIFDKLRFRIIVEKPEDLWQVLAYLTRHVFPFNYVIPGESHNNLLNPDDVYEYVAEASRPLQTVRDQPVRSVAGKNRFSGASYRTINFIVDYPVRIPESPAAFGFELGRVVYVMVEFQLLDEEQARLNEAGENSHHLYKARQHEVVAKRLKRGAFRARGTD